MNPRRGPALRMRRKGLEPWRRASAGPEWRPRLAGTSAGTVPFWRCTLERSPFGTRVLTRVLPHLKRNAFDDPQHQRRKRVLTRSRLSDDLADRWLIIILQVAAYRIHQ